MSRAGIPPGNPVGIQPSIPPGYPPGNPSDVPLGHLTGNPVGIPPSNQTGIPPGDPPNTQYLMWDHLCGVILDQQPLLLPPVEAMEVVRFIHDIHLRRS
jgi:hypothetical protein